MFSYDGIFSTNIMGLDLTRRVFTGILVALSSVTFAGGRVPQKPNIIFFIADDMRPHHCSFLPEGKGRILTPNIDRLWKEGTVMFQQHVVSPVCTPSRYNVLTGR